jgi:hypothetical protein
MESGDRVEIRGTPGGRERVVSGQFMIDLRRASRRPSMHERALKVKQESKQAS